MVDLIINQRELVGRPYQTEYVVLPEERATF